MALGVTRAPDIGRQLKMRSAYGNLSVARATHIIPAAAAQNSVHDLMELPVGVRIVDCVARMTGAEAGTVTAALGLAQLPGHLDTKVDADALILAAAISTSATIRRRNNPAATAVALTLDDTYIVQVLIAAAALGATAVTIDLDVIYEYLGTP